MDSHPLNYDPQLYGAPPPTQSRYTFFPPETVDHFSQNQWKQDQTPDFNQLPPNHLGEPHGAPPRPPSPDANPQRQRLPPPLPDDAQGKGKARADAEKPLLLQSQFEELGYTVYDDDASMGDSDDEMVPVLHQAQMNLDEVGLVVSRRIEQPSNFFDTQTRTFSFFAQDNFLAAYEPSPMSSPLNDKQIASVFWHFINVTGPSISLYERHPVDPSPLFQGQPVPRSRQHIWTCTCIFQGPVHFDIAVADSCRPIPRVIFQSSRPPPGYIGSWESADRQTPGSAADGVSATLPSSAAKNS